jgi:hypothetical protein
MEAAVTGFRFQVPVTSCLEKAVLKQGPGNRKLVTCNILH